MSEDKERSMSYYDNQPQPPISVPPSQGYPPEGYPKDAYPPQQGYSQGVGYPPQQGYPPQGYAPDQYQQPPPHRQKQSTTGPGCLEACFATLCCCCLLDACF